jgi:hypothetical protein
MSITAGRSAQRLDIGQALQDVLKVLQGNLGPFALLGIVLGGFPLALLYASSSLADQNPIFILPGLVGLIAAFVARPVLYGAIVFGTVRSLDGEAASIGSCLAAGWRKWGSLLGLMIVSGLATGVGLVLLIVPGVYLALKWAVAGPSKVLTGRGISDAMAHSTALTEGRRWSMLLFYLIVFLGLIIASLLLALVEAVVSLAGSKLLATVFDTALSNALFDVSLPIVAAVLYRRLRGDADGVATTALAEVFA